MTTAVLTQEAEQTSLLGWYLGFSIGALVVVVVVALVTPILLLARRIGKEAVQINEPLQRAVDNTAPLHGLETTIEHADVIVDGLRRGRMKLGG